MFFTAIFTVTLMLQGASFELAGQKKYTRYFKNLSPTVYKDQMIKNHNVTYSKVPTKMIKIDKNTI